NAPAEKRVEAGVDGGVEVSVPDVDTVKPSIALEKARNVNGVVEMYQDDVSGGWSSKPAKAAAHLPVAPNTIAYGRYSENRFFFSAKRARSFSDSLMKRRKPPVRPKTPLPLPVPSPPPPAPHLTP